jgi:predicted PurR-regulated permease PerM
MQPQAKTALFLAAMGAVAGAISSLVRSGWGAFLIAVVIFLLTSPLARRILKLQQDFSTLKVMTTGLWSFFIVWLVSWIWVYSALL